MAFIKKSCISLSFSLFLILLSSIFVNGQTGPGGVGTTDGTSILELWFDGRDINGNNTNPANGAAVTTWRDKSGNGINVTQNTTGVATFSNPGVTFNNTGYLLGNDSGLPTGNASRTIYVAASTPNTPADDVLFFYGNASDHNSFGILKVASEAARFFFFANDLNDASGWTPVNQTKIVVGRYVTGSPGTRQIFVDGTQTASGAPSSTPNTTVGTQGLQIGGWNSFSLFSQATISEVLFYSSALNSAQRIIIDNYLAAKYGINLSANDVYNKDNPGNGNYDFDVAGIGRVDASNIHNDSQGTGIVRILNPSGLGNNEFLMWGHDNGALQGNNTTDIPAGVQARFARIWRVSEVNSTGTAIDVGSITIRFDLSGLGSVTASDLALLVDTDDDGLFNDETPITGATNVSGSIYQFSGITSITNNVRFTLGTTNRTQTPLPIVLINFKVNATPWSEVKVSWQTASELNNDFFSIERSNNGIDWEYIANIKGAGTTNQKLDYSYLDKEPFIGTSYYRLKQTDFDGKFTYSEVQRVDIKKINESDLIIFPNPSDNEITIRGTDVSIEELRIFDLIGQELTSKAILRNISPHEIRIDLNSFSPGTYIIQNKNSKAKIFRK